MKIMFVCMGNICRSPLAHAVFDHQAKALGVADDFQTESAGTISYHVGNLPDPRARAIGATRGVDVSHRARHFRAADLDDFDLILVMDRDNEKEVLKLAKTDAQRERVRLFRSFDTDTSDGDEVPDPYYGGPEGFEHVFQLIDRTTKNLLRQLTAAQSEKG